VLSSSGSNIPFLGLLDPGPVWTGAENLATTGIRFPDRPARSESLYRLSYPCPLLHEMQWLKYKEHKYKRCYR